MRKEIFKAESRGHENYGWLDTHYSFSFAGYYNPKRTGFGTLRVLNDDTISPGGGFPFHSHANMEIVTIPIKGALEHKDTAGGKGIIGEGDIQIMSAGTGITHSEFNHSKTESVSLLQIWILPEKQNVAPRYDQKKFDIQDRKNKWQILVSPIHKESLRIGQKTYFSIIDADAGLEINYDFFEPENGLFIFIIEGAVEILGENLSRRDALGLSEHSNLTIKPTNSSSILAIETPIA